MKRSATAALFGVLIALGTGGLATFTTLGAVTPPVSPPKTIDATGRMDVTAALNAFLAGVPDGSTIKFAWKAKYRIEGTLNLKNKTNLRILGNDATFFAKTNGNIKPPTWCGPNPATSTSSVCKYPNRTRSQWNLTGDTNITIRHMVVKGSDPDPGPNGTYDASLEAQHAFNIVGRSSGITLDGVTATKVWGDFVYVGGAASRITVKNSTFDGASRQGMSVTNGDQVTIVSNTIGNTRRSLFDLEANTANDTISNVTIHDNDLGASRFCTLNNFGAPATEHDITFDGNRMHGKRLSVCAWARPEAHRQRYTITNNVGDLVSNEPDVVLVYIDGVTVSGNIQRFVTPTWPDRGVVQAPVVSKCSTGTNVRSNTFTPRPAGMPNYAVRPCV